MDESLRHINPNPVLRANFISKGIFWWCNPLFKKGYKAPLEESDLYNVCPSDSSDYLGNKLEREWVKQIKRKEKGETPSLLRALLNTFGLQYMLVGFVVFLEEGTKVIQPLLLGGLIRYFTPESTVSQLDAWLYAFGVSLCAIILAVSHHPYFFCVQRIGMRMRIACCSLMYKKCLKLSNKAMGETTTGQIVNLMSNDVNRFDQAVVFLHFLWVGPLQAIAVLVILWHELGPSVLAGFFVLLLLIPVQGFMGKLFSKLRHKTAIHTDERVKVMNEIISGMRVIKMYCWEKPFRELVEKIRGLEILKIHSTRRAQACVIAPFFSAVKLVTFCTFTSLVLTGSSMTAYRVFLTIGLFQAFRLSMTLFIPFAIQHMAESNIVMNRLEEIVPIRVARRLQGIFFLPFFMTMCITMFATFTTLILLTQRPMNSEVVFVTFGLFLALRIPLTIFIPFSVQYISELTVVSERVQEYRQLVYRSYANAYENSFYDTGPRVFFYPVIVVLVAASMPLRVSYLYLAAPLLNEVNFAIASRGTQLAKTIAEMDEMTHVGRRSHLDSVEFLIARGGHFLYLLVALVAMVANDEALRARTYGVMSLLYFIANKQLVMRLMGTVKGCLSCQVSLDRLQYSKYSLDLVPEYSKCHPDHGRWFCYIGPYEVLTMMGFLGSKFIMVPICAIIVGIQGVMIMASSWYILMSYTFVLQDLWFFMMPHGAVYAASALVAVSRLQKFLLLEELNQKSDAEKSNLRPKEDACYVQLDSVTAKWEGNTSETNTLEDISLNVDPGQLVAVIGPVGAGKSSLLMTILGELRAQKGTVKVSGKLAYVSQQPWIFSGSVRQNIVFGGVFEKTKYDRIIKVSALKRDFEIMPQGDATLIGDRGVSLSGGQRARVSLARALYMDADIYLLDDPLSAVDSAVGRHIFEQCIVKHLKNKPRILVTHQVQFLPVADTIYILKEGKINIKGSFDELSKSGVDFSELLKRPEEEEPSSPVSLTIVPHGESVFVNPEAQELGSRLSLHSMIDDYQPETVQLPEEEDRASGTVGYQVYMDYFKAGTGLFKFILLVLVNIGAQVFYVGSDWWLSRWSNLEEEKYAAIEKEKRFFASMNITDFSNSSISSNITIPYVDSHFNIFVFTGIILAVFLFGLARALLFFKIAVDASQQLHNRMFARILRSHISFFDNNPVGRILNRFSKDIGHMDDLLPVTFFDFIQCALLIIGIVLVAGIVNWYVFIPTIPLAVMFVLVRKYYLQTSRSIKRLEGTTRSPVFSYLSATLQGLHTIRSMKMEEKFQEEFDAYQDKHSEAWFLFLATSRWLAVRLDWLCAMFVTAVTVCSVLAKDTMNAGLVGLSITYTMTLMGMFQWGVRQSAEVENQMISVERVLEYSRLPEEAALESDPDKKPPPSWPVYGEIVAVDVCLQYSPSGPRVLKNLNFRIKGREKVGIVGRTGAGKSSLITTLFRMFEPQGSLLIDDINIQEIGLHDLRSTISIIPQDPVLFTGTLRKNLDPFQQHGDEQLWKSLEEVKLKDHIKDIPEGLNAEVSEGGVNFSVGQRQLICLARAILGNNRILLIDEATANVDPITDELIQQTIRTKFKDCTVLTIAHRLHTIMDSDRVMVLDNGELVEFDQPYILLSQGQGYFFDMVQQTGKAEFDHLLEVAQEAARRSDKPPVMINGITLKLPKPKYTQDNTLDDVSSSLNDASAAELSYNFAEVEDSLKLKADEAKAVAASTSLKEKGSKGTPTRGESESTRTLKTPGSASFSSRGQEDILLPEHEDDSSSDEADHDTLLKKVERHSPSGKSPSKGPQGVVDNEDKEQHDESVMDESQVLLKTGSGSGSVDNVRKRRSDKNDDDTIDV